MKRIILLMLVIGLGACSNDGDAWKLTDNIGSIPIELRDSVTFSYFLPGTGTFEFKQRFERDIKASDVETHLKILNNDIGKRSQEMEIMVFDGAKFSNEALDFVEDFSITINDTIYTKISSKGGALIDSTNFYVSLFDESGISGKYSGTAKILVEQPQDANGDDQPDKVEGLLNVFGNANADNRLFLLIKESEAIFANISGNFSTEEQLFFGEAVKDEDTFELKPQNSNGLSMPTDSTLQYNLLFTKDNVEKKLQINLTKND